MADQNILAGDINVLAQVRSDVKEYEGNCDRLYALNQSVSSLSKNIDVMCKNVKAVSYTHLTLPTTPYV